MFALLMGLRSISPTGLLRRIDAGSATVFDVNSLRSREKAHVPGALHPDPAGFSAADLPVDHQALLVFHCSNPMCRKAPGAARRAKAMGHADVRVLSAGISGWLAAKLPFEAAP